MLHSPLLFKLDAHLDLKGEDFEQHATLTDIKDLRASKVTGLASHFRLQAGRLERCKHLFEWRELLRAQIHLGQAQRSREPQALVVCFEFLKDEHVHLLSHILRLLLQLSFNQVENLVDRLRDLVSGRLISHLHQILLRLQHLVILTKLCGENHDELVRVEAVLLFFSILFELYDRLEPFESLGRVVLQHALSLVEVVLDHNGVITASIRVAAVVFTPAVSVASTRIPLHIVLSV